MSFKNMSPADRMKASGLIGLIVVIIFFVVHTVLGAVSPKKNPAGAPQPAANGTAAAPAPAGTNAANTPGGPASNTPFWPNGSKVEPNGPTIANSILTQDPENPFEPLPKNKAATNSAPANSNPAPFKEPPVQVSPGDSLFGGRNAGPLPWPGADKPMPNGLALGGPQPAAVPPPPDPEIRLIGFVHGDPPVATVQVGGRSMIVRPGDPLAKGWRLMGINSEGVNIRHSKETFTLKTGGVLNEENKVKQ